MPEGLESKGTHEDKRTQVAEAAVQARITQTGSINPMAVTPVGTVALFPAVLPEKSLGAPWQQREDSWEDEPVSAGHFN